MKDLIYSDLALESATIEESRSETSREIKEFDFGFAKLSELVINDKLLSQKHQRPIGRYLTISTEQIWLMSEVAHNALSSLIGNELSKMICELVPDKQKRTLSVLVVGLGNSDITSDAIGPQTVSRLTVTSHIEKIDPHLFSKLEKCKVSAFVPGVLAQTGIETLDLIQGVVLNSTPDVVIVIDALAARSCQRLGRTIQISDTGISPGSGIGNNRKRINRDSLGVPVIAIGVPTVVDSATLVYDALENAGIDDVPKKLLDVLDNSRSFFVTPKECDIICDSVAILLSNALDIAFSL